MTNFSTKVVILGIICRIYVNTAKSNSQSAPIISGTPATPGQFPWHVLLWINETDDGNVGKCGGSIISNKWVLTSAHCIENFTSLELVFGTIDLFDNPINMTSTTSFIHPDYNDNTLTDDIALIELPVPLNFTENIKAIDLVSSAETSNDFLCAQGIITGFGATSDIIYNRSQWLLWTTIEIVNNSLCTKAHDVPNDNRTMCGIGWNGSNKAPCIGDSGGALVWKNQANKFVQIGIVAFAKKSCSRFPAGYTRITTYLDYIHNITGLTL